MPVPGTANAAYTGITSPVIIYSKDGPQASYSPYYISDGVNGTASISFNNTITGAAGNRHGAGARQPGQHHRHHQ